MIARLAPASLTKDIGTLFAHATASHARAIAILFVVSLISFLPGFFNIPPVDRDEARFAQATKQMIESGDYIDIHFQDEVRYKKPVGIYWLQAGVVSAADAIGVSNAHTSIWLYRVPSLIGAIVAVLLTYWAALAFVTRYAAFLAALMMATSILLNVEARLAKTDAVLLMCCVAALGVMARAYLTQSTGRDIPWRHALLLWTAIAAGILLKGPLILMVVGLAALALVVVDRSGAWLMRLRPMVGVLWILLLVLPWFVAIMGRAGDSFLQESVGQDLLAKIFKGQETHGAPPGYYLLLFWATFWPAAPLAAVAAPAVWRHRREPPMRFLLAWLLPCWLVFELVVTKLPHYVLPLYPAVAILIAREIERRDLSRNPHLTRFTVMWPIFMAVIPAAAVWLVLYLRGQFAWLAWPFGAVGLILGFYAWRLYDVEGAERSFLRAAAGTLCMIFAVLGVAVPLMRPVFPSQALAEIVRGIDCRNPVIAAVGFHEPSLVFLVGTHTRLVDASSAAEILRGGDCRFAIVEARHERAFAQRAEQIGLRYRLGRRLDGGFNLNGGRQVSFAIYRAEPPL
ncbi:MAG: glycosyltransferase family 39 protein [Alphaproteobacteria bacterium]